MGANPINLAVRFVLEVAALVSFGFWGWAQSDGVLRLALALGLPLMAGALWGTFNVADDPSRPGKAPVPVPGLVRLALEVVLFGLAVWALADTGQMTWAWVLGAALVVHYAISYDRVVWLLKR